MYEQYPYEREGASVHRCAFGEFLDDPFMLTVYRRGRPCSYDLHYGRDQLAGRSAKVLGVNSLLRPFDGRHRWRMEQSGFLQLRRQLDVAIHLAAVFASHGEHRARSKRGCLHFQHRSTSRRTRHQHPDDGSCREAHWRRRDTRV